jgi:hypothetical protein
MIAQTLMIWLAFALAVEDAAAVRADGPRAPYSDTRPVPAKTAEYRLQAGAAPVISLAPVHF